MLRITQGVNFQTLFLRKFYSSPLPRNTLGYSLRNDTALSLALHHGRAGGTSPLRRHCDNEVRSPSSKCTSGRRCHQRCASSAVFTEAPRTLETSEGRSDSIVSVVLPLGNEDPTITYLISSIGQVIAEKQLLFEILCIDNGSNNGTGAVLRALASEASFVKVVILSRRVEDAAALSAGLEYAVGDVIVTLRGDLTSAPHDVSTLLNALLSGEGAGRGSEARGKRPDLVCGWRRDSTLTFRQKVVSKVASWLMAGVTQSGLRDLSSGAQAFHASLLETSVSPFSPALTAMAGATVTEVELSPRSATSNPQNRTTAATCKLAWAVLSSAFLTRFQQQPMQLVGPLGGLCLVGSAVFGAQFWRSLLSGWAAYGSWAMAWSASASHFMASLELLIMGAQLLCTGLVAEIGMRTFFAPRGGLIYDVVEVVNS